MVAAQAALHDRGRGLIYDDVLNITWMADANYGITSGWFDPQATVNGAVDWFDAQLLPAYLSYVNYGGYHDWRLPSALKLDGSGVEDNSCGGPVWPCGNSELSFMFYHNMDAQYGHSILEGRNTANLALFKNLQPYEFWTNTPFLSLQFLYTFRFDTGTFSFADNGYSDTGGLAIPWAVRDGDVIEVSAVPEPQTAALMLAGVGLAGWAARRRRPGAIV
jgi:hypothetical protein